MKSVIKVCNTEFKFNILSISKCFRINFDKLDKLVNFDKKEILKLHKYKNSYKVCSVTGKVIKSEMIQYIRSDYEFMSQIMEIIDLIKNYNPRSLDYSDVITGSDTIKNENFVSNNDIVIKWYYKGVDNLNDKVLITIF